MPRTIDIDPNGGTPEAVLTIGHANTGAFVVHLFDANRTNHRQLTRGTARNGAGLPIPIPGTVVTLPGKILTWDAVVIPITGSRFSVTLAVLQDGREVASFTDFGDVNAGDNVGILRAGATLV